jgi:hypothetical protein
VIELREQQSTLMRLHLGSISGQGRVSPRLVIDFRAETAGDLHAEVHRMRVEVTADMEHLGTGSPRSVVTDVYPYGAQLRIDVPINRAVVDFVDARIRGTQVTVKLAVEALLRVRSEPRSAPGQAVAAEPGPWREVYCWPMQWDIPIPRSEWIGRVIEPLGTDRFVFLEVEIPPVPDHDRWRKALDHLDAAERLYREGNDAEVLQRCYAAFEALEGAPKAIFASVLDEAKRERLNEALRPAKEYMHSGRHVSEGAAGQAGLYPVDHRDAAFALGQAKLWLGYVSALLRGS